MKLIDNETAFQILINLVSSNGRGDTLFGDSLERVRRLVPGFLGNGPFPDIYIEFPLSGDPFLDIAVTAVFDDTSDTTYIDSPLALGIDRMMEFLRDSYRKYPNSSGGFEIDTKSSVPGAAGVFFQPKEHIYLAGEFCEAIGEPQYGKLYEELAHRLKDSWEPCYFGIFRGRPGVPLRVGGYLTQNEIRRCMDDPDRIVRIFNAAGFKAYDDQMIRQIIAIMAETPTQNEYQFDIYPDGTVGDIFSLSTNFEIEHPKEVLASFEDGAGKKRIDLLKQWNIVDERWEKASGIIFARALPLGAGAVTFTSLPQWLKARWIGGKLQPAKMYMVIRSAEL